MKVKLYPDLITSNDLKRITSIVLGKSISEDKGSELHYLHFEKVLKAVSEHCFPTGNSMKLLITHIKPLCQALFSVNLTAVVPFTLNLNVISPYKHPLQVPVSVRHHNQSARNLKVLNNSNSQRFSFKYDSIIIPRDSGNVTSRSKIRSPRLKIISIKEKMIDKGKLEKIISSLGKLQHSLKKPIKPIRQKKALKKMIETLQQVIIRIVIHIQHWAKRVTFQIWYLKSRLRKSPKILN